ncbi:MAG: 30S ribosomal protein S5 [Kiritimatiellia bacterium]|nr:30S ribosomal protein S5 [Lentisphaerota bacterium]
MSADQIAGKFYADRSDDAPSGELEEYVVRINRCSKVVKGGRRLSFSAVVVVGDHRGTVGFGLGKANEVAEAIRKGGDVARKTLLRIKTFHNTIPHEVIGEFCGARVLLKPAADGTGVIAGGGVRAVLNLSGVHNIIAKSLGSNNKWNVVHATIEALKQLRTIEECEEARGVELVPRRSAPVAEEAVAEVSAPA